MKLNSIRLLVTDFDACFTFYSEVLQLETTWGKLGDVYASFATGSATALSIFSKSLMLADLGISESPTTPTPQQVICFESDDIDADYQRLSAAGAKFINSPKDMPGWGIRCAHLSDPDGNIIELNQELSQDKWSDELLENTPENY